MEVVLLIVNGIKNATHIKFTRSKKSKILNYIAKSINSLIKRNRKLELNSLEVI